MLWLRIQGHCARIYGSDTKHKLLFYFKLDEDLFDEHKKELQLVIDCINWLGTCLLRSYKLPINLS